MSSSVRRDWVLYATLTFCFAFGFAVYNGIFQNFFRDTIGANSRQLGILESLREVPGLLTAILAGTLVALAEVRLAALALVVCAIGIGATGHTGSYWPLVGVTVLWSVGGHLWFSVQPAITLGLAQGREGGKHLGRMGAVGSAATLAGLAFTLALKRLGAVSPGARAAAAGAPAGLLQSLGAYRSLFVLAGACVLAAGVLALLLRHRASGGQRQRLVYRREYRLFYYLTFLEGCRRQVFGTFASFVLIAVYNQSVTTMLTLAFINAGVMVVVGPAVGRWIDRRGEQTTMTFYYSVLILVFAGYAFVPWVGALRALYVLDALLFSFSMGITTYLHRIVRPDEMTPSLAMGQTMNHIAAVLVPVTGGVLWFRFHDYQIPFYIGIGVLVLSLLAARRLPPGAHVVAPEREAAAVS